MSQPEPSLSWCDLDPNRVWRAPTPKEELGCDELQTSPEMSDDSSSMMRLTHNTSCISLSALEQQPSGSSATIYPPSPVSRPTTRRPTPLEDDLLVNNMQNVSIFSNDSGLAGLGITNVPMGQSNPWQPNGSSFGTASTNGFTGSDTSSAPMSPISSPGLRKQAMGRNGFQAQQSQRIMNKNAAHPNHFRTNNHGVPQYQNHHHLRAPAPQMVPSRTIQLRPTEEYQPGMRDLPYWLKKLRLHKYAPLFQDMTYRQLLQLNNTTLERMRITNGARKKIAQSIEKLHERPLLLRTLELKLKSGTQCVRCAICSVRQLLWSPFIKFDGGSRKTSTDILDGFNVPSQMISDDNLAALIYRVIETLNQMIFPLRKGLLDLEDEYQLTMFHMFDSIMKNESFTQNQQKRAFAMKKNARNYANPEEIRRHRMGMVSSSQCEGCHHAEVVNRERLMELADRQVRRARGDFVGQPTLSSCSAILDLTTPRHEARLEFNVPPASLHHQRIQKRPALLEDEDYLTTTGSPKISSVTQNPETAMLDGFNLPTLDNAKQYWVNVNEIWRDETEVAPMAFPEYKNPANEENKKASTSASATEDFNKPTFNFLRMLSEDQPPKTPSLSDFAFPESVASSSKKANSTGSGYSSSDSESSSPATSSFDDCSIPPKLVYGVNQVLCPSTFQFHPSAASYM